MTMAAPGGYGGYGGHGGIAYAAPAVSYAAPAVSYAAPAVSYAAPAISYAAPAKVAIAAAPAISYAAPAKVAIAAAPAIIKAVEPEPYDPNPKYSFAYGVSDHSTGDSKSAEEHLENGVIHGSYSLTEADGSIRKVTYTADKINGFNAVVEKSGQAIIAKPVAVAAAVPVAKVAYAAPAVTYAAPAVTKVAYAAPAVAKVAYAAAPAYYGAIILKVTIVCLALVAAIDCALLRAPLAAPVAAALPINTEIDPHPQYAFAYNVQDALTGDSKSQQEVRDGDVVKGSYSVVDADGSLRTVFYTADPINGFNAIVQRGPVPVAAPIVAPRPVLAPRPVALVILSALLAVASAVVIPAPAYPGLHGPLLAHGLHGPLLAPALHGPALLPKLAAPIYPTLAKTVVAKVAAPEPYDPNPQYSFSYDVHDHSTGDVKSQQETRNGDTVQGAYSLIEPDGTRRLVEYTADPIHGFNAVVHREPVAVKVAPVAKILAPAPLLHAAPLIAKPLLPAYPALAKVAAPLAYPAHLGYPAYH
ncbi:uncharacterized protein LOC135953723 [Calliphora vicina]|uniref:uncharacterized protein LOC135953723 n=1 Tax=Calliphora vicina TaxID=7373 RepID=UPI00325A7238